MGRKKVCTKCKRKLWMRDFYKHKSYYSSKCKDCTKEEMRMEYAEKKKVPDKKFYDESKGLYMEHKGYSTRISWSGNMLCILKRHYATTFNEELAELIGVSPRTLVRKARELGISKDPDWMKEVCRTNARYGAVVSKKNRKLKKNNELWNESK